MFSSARMFRIGLAIWAAATLVIRLLGHRLLFPGQIAFTLALYAISFALMALLAPLILELLRVEKSAWPEGATLLILPTLLLDSFSCLFFANIFPRMDPAAAGIFGGWMLICCAGAVIGTMIRR